MIAVRFSVTFRGISSVAARLFAVRFKRTAAPVRPPITRLADETGKLETAPHADLSIFVKDGLPVVLHADDDPALLLRLFHQ
jgi:hypothetical protein